MFAAVFAGKITRKTASRNGLTNIRSPLQFAQGSNRLCYYLHYLRPFPRTVNEICFETIQRARSVNANDIYLVHQMYRQKSGINSRTYLGCHPCAKCNKLRSKETLRNMRPDQNKVILPITWEPLACRAISYSARKKNQPLVFDLFLLRYSSVSFFSRSFRFVSLLLCTMIHQAVCECVSAMMMNVTLSL